MKTIIKTGSWTVCRELGSFSVRRWVYHSGGSKSFQRMPKKDYKKYLKEGEHGIKIEHELVSNYKRTLSLVNYRCALRVPF